MFLSSNNGSSWTDVSNGLTNKQVNTLAINGDTLFAGTNGAGVWKRTLSELTSMEETNNNEINIAVYPNPANDNITISNEGEITKESIVSIFDIEGRRIMQKKFKNQNMFEIDVNMLPKGVFLIKIQTEKGIESKKLVIQ